MSRPPSDHDVPECQCPVCECSIDGAGNFFDDHGPQPGTFAVCSECRNLNVFAEDLTLRAPTDEELVAIAGAVEFRAMTKALARVQRKSGRAETARTKCRNQAARDSAEPR